MHNFPWSEERKLTGYHIRRYDWQCTNYNDIFAICRLTYIDSINCYPKIKEIEYVLLPENMKKKYKCIDKRMPLYIGRHTQTR